LYSAAALGSGGGAVAGREDRLGSDYPFTTVRASIDGPRSLNAMLEGTALPRLDEQAIESLIHRDSLRLLGLTG
jgi:hypothetical protein